MFRVSFLLFVLSVSAVGQPVTAAPCHSIVLTGDMLSGGHFKRPIGGDLIFRLEPERLGSKAEISGWRISVVSSHQSDRDYIYPANPPLRFNPLQILGPIYGYDTKTSLTHPHVMRFLLGRADYDRISPLLTEALWPYGTARPDSTADKYIGALKASVLGQLTLTVQSYDADAVSGSIGRIAFRARFIAPVTFAFDPALKPRPAPCPAAYD